MVSNMRTPTNLPRPAVPPEASGAESGDSKPGAAYNSLKQALRHSFDGDELFRLSTLTLGDLWRARKDIRLNAALARMDLVVPERAVSRWASRSLGDRVSELCRRSVVLDAVLEEARDNGRLVFFMGGRESEPFDWARRARTRFPGLILAGAHAPGPDFRDEQGARRLCGRINGARSDVVIALSTTTRGIEFPFRYGDRLASQLYFDLRGGPCSTIAKRSARAVRRSLVAPRPARVVLVSD